jgi:hypothetical protein
MMSMRMTQMTKATMHVPTTEFKQVEHVLKKSGVKFYPFRRTQDGYQIEFEPYEHPLVVYLILRYEISVMMQND